MALIVADRVLETTTTTGTGAVTLAGAQTGYRTFSSVMVNADTTWYTISSASGEWEVGVGTYNTGNTLSRTTVLASSNGNALVNFPAGSKFVFNTAPASILALIPTSLQFDDIGATVQAYDANTTKNNVANNFTQPNEFDKTSTAWTAEAYNATQTLDALVPAGTTTLTGNMTLNAVSNSTTGEMQVIVRAFTQDATGGRTLAFNTAVFSASGANFPQPTSTANRVSLFQFTKMPDGKWVVQSLNDVRST